MRYLLAIVILIYFSSCVQQESEKVSEKVVNTQDTAIIQARVIKEFKFGSEVSTIEGTLQQEEQFGPPGYGEDPKNDSKENLFFLYLEAPINVYSIDSLSDSFDVTTKGIDKVQLNSPDVDLVPFINKKITVQGVFFGAHTGHHHTDVLMDVSKVN